MNETRLIIAGGRDFDDYYLLKNKTNDLIKNNNIDTDSLRIISGAARGADTLGKEYAQTNGYLITVMPANWDLYGKSAGFRRNIEMADYAIADNSRGILLAFWDGKSKGTKHMIDIANKYKMEVNIVYY